MQQPSNADQWHEDLHRLCEDHDDTVAEKFIEAALLHSHPSVLAALFEVPARGLRISRQESKEWDLTVDCEDRRLLVELKALETPINDRPVRNLETYERIIEAGALRVAPATDRAIRTCLTKEAVTCGTQCKHPWKDGAPGLPQIAYPVSEARAGDRVVLMTPRGMDPSWAYSRRELAVPADLVEALSFSTALARLVRSEVTHSSQPSACSTALALLLPLPWRCVPQPDAVAPLLCERARTPFLRWAKKAGVA